MDKLECIRVAIRDEIDNCHDFGQLLEICTAAMRIKAGKPYAVNQEHPKRKRSRR